MRKDWKGLNWNDFIGKDLNGIGLNWKVLDCEGLDWTELDKKEFH